VAGVIPSGLPRPSRSTRWLIAAGVAVVVVAGAIAVPLLLRSGAPQPAATLTDEPNGSDLGVNGVAFSPDGAMLATAYGDGNIDLWDVATGKLAATLTDPGGLPGGLPVFGLAFSPNGATLATAGARTYLWDVATGTLTATLTDPGGGTVNAVAFSPGGGTLAAADWDGSTYLWDVATGKLTATLTDPSDGPDDQGVRGIAFSPGGGTLAAADWDGSTYLWDVATGKVTATLTDPSDEGSYGGDNNSVDAVAFSPGGGTLATADEDGSTYLWDVATGKV